MADKKRKKREIVRCWFECPTDPKLEFNVWKDQGEPGTDACWRGLGKHVEKPQHPFCKLKTHRIMP